MSEYFHGYWTTQKEGKEKITVVTVQKREVSDSKDVLILNN